MSISSPTMHHLSMLKEILFGDNISYEVLECYADRLSDKNIRVSWKRDGDFIVGEILISGERYFTQAKSAREFVEMVNDVVYSVYEVPFKYVRHLGGYYRIRPSKEEFEKLNNAAVEKSSFEFDQCKVSA